MPSPWIKKISKETGKSEKEIEKLWDKAKIITSEEFGKKEDQFGNKEYSYTVGVVKNMLGVDESLLNPAKFLESELSAEKYLETLVSSKFTIGNVKSPEKEEEEEEEENEVEEKKVKSQKEEIIIPVIEEKTDFDENEESFSKQLDSIIDTYQD